MITIRKLSTLPPGSIIRKSANLFAALRRMLQRDEYVSPGYILDLCRLPELQQAVSQKAKGFLQEASVRMPMLERSDRILMLDDLHHLLLEEIGASVADWDFTEDDSSALDIGRREIFPVQVYLDRVRSPYNVGSIFRTADSFGVSKILVAEGSASPEHPRAIRTARGCTSTVSWETVDSLDTSDPIFALELGGTQVNRFSFPERGTVIIGSEELGVSPRMLEAAHSSLGLVSIPLSGTKGSLNVSVAFGILMQYWFSYLSL